MNLLSAFIGDDTTRYPNFVNNSLESHFGNYFAKMGAFRQYQKPQIPIFQHISLLGLIFVLWLTSSNM